MSRVCSEAGIVPALCPLACMCVGFLTAHLSPPFPTAARLMWARHGTTFAAADPTFNAGVWGVNFDLWRAQNINQEVDFWMDQVRIPLSARARARATTSPDQVTL